MIARERAAMDTALIPDLAGIEVVHAEVARALRAKSGAGRLRLAHETWELAQERLTAFLAARHPEWSVERVRREVARRLLGESS